MKAPDKIYVDNFGCYAIEPRESHSIIAGEEVCYIRKDALLELLKPERALAFSDEYERGCIDGRNDLREELINKLNSM